MLAQLVPPSWALRLTNVSRPCQRVFQLESWQQPSRMWHKHLKVLVCKIWCSWNLLLYQPTWQFCQMAHMFLWLLSLSCCLEDMVQQPWAKHPDGSKCQPLALADTDLMCFTMVSGGDVWCQLGLMGLTCHSMPNSSWQQPSGNQQQTTHPRIGRHVATAPRLKQTNHARQHVLQWCVQQLWGRLPN